MLIVVYVESGMCMLRVMCILKMVCVESDVLRVVC